MNPSDSHQHLKAQLMSAMDRACRSVDATHKKTRDIRIALEEEEPKEDSKIFKLTKRLNIGD